MNPRIWSIKKKLVMVTASICVSTLLLAGVALLVRDVITLKQSMARDYSIQAAIAGRAITPALVFDDPESATSTLAALLADAAVIEARIYDADGALFAEYRRDPGAGFLPPARPEPRGHRFDADRLTLFEPLTSDGVRIGTLSMVADLAPLSRAVWHSVAVLAMVLASSGLFAFLLTSRLQRLVSGPILRLADAAAEIGRGNLALRVPVDGDDELSQLAAALNQMAHDLGVKTLSKNYADQIFESMRESLVVVGPDRLIERVNGATRELLQRDEPEILGRPAESLFGDDPAGRPDLEEAFALGFTSRTEAVYRAKDGLGVPVSFSASVMADESGRARGLVLVAADITARKKAEREIVEAREAALEASRLKSEFVANMSHEIRTPLNGIIGMTELTLDTELTEEQRGYLEAVTSSYDSLLSLVDDILDFSKIEAGKMEMEATPFGLRDCLVDALQPLEARARQKGLDLGLRMAHGIANDVIGDPSRIRKVVAHLVGNAVKFTDAGSVRLEVDVERIGEGEASYHFVVSDTGIGIPPGKRKTIFDVFAQADGSMTRSYGGTGLGLAICKSLVTNLGGRLWMDSEVGKGSDFHFVVPLKLYRSEEKRNEPLAAGKFSESSAALAGGEPGETRTGVPAQQSPRDGAKRLRVLLAEDNTVNRTVATRTLEKRGHFVRAVENGREAVMAFEIGSFDVVLMDVQMPVMDGLEATALIRKKEQCAFSRVPIVAFTAHAMKGDRERCLAAGMDDYLTKPFKAKDMILAVESGRGELETAEDPGVQILNRVSLLERVEGDQVLVGELVKVFFEETPPLLRAIRSAFQEGDVTAMGKAAHRLRGTLTTIGAERATAPALRLELSSRNEWPEPDDSALAELERELLQLEPELLKLAVG